MKVYCTAEFREILEKLSRKKPYSTLMAQVMAQYCNTTYARACTGDPLSVFPNAIYLKKRLEGGGGYRVYVLGIVKDDAIYLVYVHPKTGPDALANVSMEKKKALLKNVLAVIKSKTLHEVAPDPNDPTKLKFG